MQVFTKKILKGQIDADHIVNRVMPIPMTQVSSSVFAPHNVQRILEKYEDGLPLCDGQYELKFDNLKDYPQRGSYIRKFFSYGMVPFVGTKGTTDREAYTEHTVIFAYGQRVLSHYIHKVMDDGSSILRSRVTYMSSMLRRYETYANDGVLAGTVYVIGDDITISLGHTDQYQMRTLSADVDAHECKAACYRGNKRIFCFYLDYDTYKDFDFSDYDAVLAHPTLEFDISMNDNPNAYEMILNEYQQHHECTEREYRSCLNRIADLDV